MTTRPATATLTVRDGPKRGEIFELQTISTVGRSSKCTVPIDDADASRSHLVIEFEANEYTVRDNGSANGTYLNGRRINTAALRHGDLVRLGGTTLVFQIGVSARSASSENIAATLPLRLDAPPFEAVDAKSPPAVLANALRKYQVLFKTDALIAHLKDRDGFLQLVLEQLFEVMAADRGLVLLGTSDDNVEIAASFSKTQGLLQKAISTTLLKRVLSAGEAVLVRDTLLDERMQDASSQLATGSRSLLCAPLVTADRITFGAIQLESHSQQAAFDEDDLRMLGAVARQIATSLSHQKIEQTRREAVERSTLRRSLSQRDAERLLKGSGDWRMAKSHRLGLLFVDLRALTTGLEGAGAFAALNARVDPLAEIVHAHHGVLSRLTPDALLAFWGAPFREADDLRRVVETALDLKALWSKEGQFGSRPLRAALHFGDGLVGEFGSRHRIDYAVVGAEVENVARLSAHVAPGEVAASEAFYRELSTVLEGSWTAPFTLSVEADAPTRLFSISRLGV